jgi:hypothetical protein
MSVQKFDRGFIFIGIVEFHFNIEPAREFKLVQVRDNDVVMKMPPGFINTFDQATVVNPFPRQFPDFGCRQSAIAIVACDTVCFFVIDPVKVRPEIRFRRFANEINPASWRIDHGQALPSYPRHDLRQITRASPLSCFSLTRAWLPKSRFFHSLST